MNNTAKSITKHLKYAIENNDENMIYLLCKQLHMEMLIGGYDDE